MADKGKGAAKSGAAKPGKLDPDLEVDLSDSKPDDTIKDKFKKVQHGATPAVEHEGADADLAEASIKDLTGVATKTKAQAYVAKAAAQFAQMHAIEGLEDENGDPLTVMDFSYDSDGTMVAITETRTRWKSSPGSGTWTNETKAKAERRAEALKQQGADYEKSEQKSAEAQKQVREQTRKEIQGNS